MSGAGEGAGLPPGTIDLHLHSAPDAAARWLDDLALAQTGPARGLAGAVLKCHLEPTGGRARLARGAGPGFLAFGGLVLNRAAGGLNPDAVDALADLAPGVARIVWLPTRDAANERARKGRAGPEVPATEAGPGGPRPLPALVEVAARAGARGLVLASGHLAPEETVAAFRALKGTPGARLATHVTAPVTPFAPDQVAALLEAGAWVEISARNLLRRGEAAEADAAGIDRALALLRRFGPDRFVLSSDLGDRRYPEPVAGLAAAARALGRAGLGDAGVEALLVANPRALLGLPAHAPEEAPAHG